MSHYDYWNGYVVDDDDDSENDLVLLRRKQGGGDGESGCMEEAKKIESEQL